MGKMRTLFLVGILGFTVCIKNYSKEPITERTGQCVLCHEALRGFDYLVLGYETPVCLLCFEKQRPVHGSEGKQDKETQTEPVSFSGTINGDSVGDSYYENAQVRDLIENAMGHLSVEDLHNGLQAKQRFDKKIKNKSLRRQFGGSKLPIFIAQSPNPESDEYISYEDPCSFADIKRRIKRDIQYQPIVPDPLYDVGYLYYFDKDQNVVYAISPTGILVQAHTPTDSVFVRPDGQYLIYDEKGDIVFRDIPCKRTVRFTPVLEDKEKIEQFLKKKFKLLDIASKGYSSENAHKLATIIAAGRKDTYKILKESALT